MDLLILFLLVVGIVLCLVQAFSVSLGRVAPGWIGLALFGLAYLLSSGLPG